MVCGLMGLMGVRWFEKLEGFQGLRISEEIESFILFFHLACRRILQRVRLTMAIEGEQE